MFLDSFLHFVTEYFLVVLILYWLFLVRPYPIMSLVALALALLITATIILESEYFTDYIYFALSALHLLPSSEYFDAPEECEDGIQKAFVWGIYCCLAVVAIIKVILAPLQQLLGGRDEYEKK